MHLSAKPDMFFGNDIHFNYDFFIDLVKHYRIVNKFFSGQFTVYKEILTRSNQWTLPLNSVTHYFIKDQGDLSISFYNGAYDSSTKLKYDVKKFINLVSSFVQTSSRTIFGNDVVHIDLRPADIQDTLELLHLNKHHEKTNMSLVIENLFEKTLENLEGFNNFFRKNEIKSEFFSEEGWHLIYTKFLEMSTQVNNEFIKINVEEHYNKAVFLGMLISHRYMHAKLLEFYAKDSTLLFHFCQDLLELINMKKGFHEVIPGVDVKLMVDESARIFMRKTYEILAEIGLIFPTDWDEYTI